MGRHKHHKFKTLYAFILSLAYLDSLFCGLVNTTSTSIGVKGGGWWGSHEVAGSSDFKTEESQMVSIEALLCSTYHKM